ncbi:MAG: hypothetical protein QF704_01820 [Anaerolineales bacterium]|nr:hypothetical protein [Anaerolineales bacterium]
MVDESNLQVVRYSKDFIPVNLVKPELTMPSMISQQQTTAGSGVGQLNFGIDYGQY